MIVERYGCDGKKSTWPDIKFDDCEVCGGKNECFDCNNDKYGSTYVTALYLLA